MRIEPLPIPTRLLGGEVVNSYAGRHARNNGLRADEIEQALRETDQFPRSKGKRHPERLAAWRALGGLHERAFTEPQAVHGNWVIERPLCSRCVPRPEEGTGRLPWVGWVCLKHKRWIKGDHRPISHGLVRRWWPSGTGAGRSHPEGWSWTLRFCFSRRSRPRWAWPRQS